MGRACALACLLVPLLVACAGVPRLRPFPGDERPARLPGCGAPFLTKEWRLIHSISGSFPGGGGTTMIGVTEARPSAGRLHCVLMSVEGLVLSDAVYDGKLVIRRGIGPFSNPDMVMGMVRDIRLILFAPAGPPAGTGLADGKPTCRYESGGDVTDVSAGTGGSIDLVQYAGGTRSRMVRFSRMRGDGIPARIELTSRGPIGYSLLLDLIEAEEMR